MTSKSEGVHPPALESEDDLDEVFSHANPNPQRIGCPSQDELAMLARRMRPIGDPGYEHLAACSPCYVEFRVLQQSIRRRARRRLWRSLVAATLIVGAVVGWLAYAAWQRSTPAITSPGAPVEAAVARLQIDLRPYEVSRSNGEHPPTRPLVFPRTKVQAVVILPVGAEPGQYELQLLDSNRQPRVSTTAAARLQNFQTTFEAVLDLRSLPTGLYQFAVRQRGEGWRTFPAEVR